MGYLQNLFKGRLNQIGFTSRLLMCLVFYVFFKYLDYIFFYPILQNLLFNIVVSLFSFFGLTILGTLYICSLFNRRFHDLGYGNFWIFLLISVVGYEGSFILSFFGESIGVLGVIIIPYIDILLLLFLIIKPGMKGANKYGSALSGSANYFINSALGLIIILVLIAWLNLSYVQSIFPEISKYFTDKVIVPKTRIVMTPGMEILAKTPTDQITIKAGPKLSRTYIFDNCKQIVTLDPRVKPWNGSQGAYSAGAYFPGLGSQALVCRGDNYTITRVLAEESERDFGSETEAVNWLKNNYKDNLVYNNSGLVVAWSKTRSSDALSIDIWQILINGQKLKALEGADDSNIQVN